MKKSIWILLLLVIFVAGCASENNKGKLNPKKPVVIVLWHSYNAYAKSSLDKLITEFNDTIGLEKGIIVEAYTYGTAKDLDNAIYDSAQKSIGSSVMPHIFSASSGSADRVNRIKPLVSLTKYFESEELAEYYTDFLEEGLLGEQAELKILPVAKSTEVLYINKTDWDKFSKDSGYSTEHLKTWEELLNVAEAYHEWSGGKAMFGINPLNTIMSITAQQLATPIYIEEDEAKVFKYNETTARKIWDLFYVPHIKGFYETAAYAADGVKSGDIIAYLGSSAGAAYFPSEVTLNSKEFYSVESMILPYPTFQNGKLYTSQRGAGMSITTSDERHEYAAAEFLKWLTAPKQTFIFSDNTGYLPVKNVVLDSLSNKKPKDRCNTIIDTCNIVTINMMKTHKFYSEKTFVGYHTAGSIFNNDIFVKIQNDLHSLSLRLQSGEDKQDVIMEMTDEEAFQTWYQNMNKKVVMAINNARNER